MPSTTLRDVLQLSARSSAHIVESFIGHVVHPPGRVLFNDDEGMDDSVTRGTFSLFWEAVVRAIFISQGDSS